MRPDHPPGDDIFSNAAELKRHFQSHLITQQSPRVWTSQYQPRNDATIQCLESSAAQRHHTQTKCVTTTRRIQGAPPYVASTRTFPKRQSRPQVAPFQRLMGFLDAPRWPPCVFCRLQSITKHYTTARHPCISQTRQKCPSNGRMTRGPTHTKARPQ